MKIRRSLTIRTRSDTQRGFALVITLVLLALMVLAIFALSALAKVNSRIAGSALQQTQARQNALLAFETAVGELQRDAGPDNRITGMAGVSGVAPQSTFRQWAGVWGGVTSPHWLVSGASGSSTPSLSGARVTIVGARSVGSPINTTDQESVEVGLIDVPGLDVQGLAARAGRMGYWVGDEGVKVSAVIGDDALQSSGSGTGIRPNFRGLIGTSFSPASTSNEKLISMEQLKVAVTGFTLSTAFHSLTRTHFALGSTAPAGIPRPGNYVLGAFNINTTSETAWRALLEFPDSNASIFNLGSARALSAARGIRDSIAAHAQPFTSVNELLNSGIIQQAFDNASPKVTTLTQEQFVAELAPIFAVRSDTFRIRAYGEVIDPLDVGKVTASAYCEAIVQRTPEMTADGLGRRFVVTYFRWLSRDDI